MGPVRVADRDRVEPLGQSVETARESVLIGQAGPLSHEAPVGHHVLDVEVFLLHDRRAARVRHLSLDAHDRIDRAKLTLPTEDDLVGAETEQSRGAVSPERDEHVPLVTRRAQRGRDTPRDVDGAAAAIDEEVKALHVADRAKLLKHRPHRVVANLRWGRGAVAGHVGDDAAATRLLDLLDEGPPVSARHRVPPAAPDMYSRLFLSWRDPWHSSGVPDRSRIDAEPSEHRRRTERTPTEPLQRRLMSPSAQFAGTSCRFLEEHRHPHRPIGQEEARGPSGSSVVARAGAERVAGRDARDEDTSEPGGPVIDYAPGVLSRARPERPL